MYRKRPKPYDKPNANAVGQGGLPLLSAPPVQKEQMMGSLSDDVFNHSSSFDITLQSACVSPSSTQECNYSLADIERLLQNDDSDDASDHSTAVTPKDIDSLLDKSALMDDLMIVSAEDLFQTNCI